jgi:hypothetical protein
VTASFRREVGKNCTLLGYHAASSDNYLPTFRDIGPETSIRNYYYSLSDNPEERSSDFHFILGTKNNVL